MMYLDCRNVLSKNYKWKINYLLITGIIFKKIYSIKIPYFIKSSNLDKQTIEAIHKVVNKLNRE